jgi:transcriptional regulator with XRE-family HTH domain
MDVQKINIERIGTMAKAIRQMKGMSQSEVCERGEIPNSYLYQLEQGEYPTPGIKQIQKVACGLGYSLPEFLELIQEIE